MGDERIQNCADLLYFAQMAVPIVQILDIEVMDVNVIHTKNNRSISKINSMHSV